MKIGDKVYHQRGPDRGLGVVIAGPEVTAWPGLTLWHVKWSAPNGMKAHTTWTDEEDLIPDPLEVVLDWLEDA